MNLEEFEIKIAQEKDSDEVIKMLKEIAQWMKDNDIDQWGFLLEGGDDQEIAQAISSQETYIITKDDDLIGTFTLLPNQGGWDKHIWGEDSSNSLYLHRLSIKPEHMNKGVGRSILDWIYNNVSGQDFLKLDCVADNTKLNDFYKNYGFEQVGLTDGHYKYQLKLR